MGSGAHDPVHTGGATSSGDHGAGTDPGSTKTRLQPLLGSEGCARLQAALIRRAAALDAGYGFLAHTPSEAGALLRPLVGPRLILFPQEGPNLGTRMAAAVVAVHRPGPVIVIGTDCPVLRRAHLAAARLAQGCDVVLGPAHDGGYYLIALAHPDARVFALPASVRGGPDVTAHHRRRGRGRSEAGVYRPRTRPGHSRRRRHVAHRSTAAPRARRAITPRQPRSRARVAPGHDGLCAAEGRSW